MRAKAYFESLAAPRPDGLEGVFEEAHIESPPTIYRGFCLCWDGWIVKEQDLELSLVEEAKLVMAKPGKI